MEQGAGNIFYQLIPLIFLFAVFYFLLIRPQKKQQKAHQLMIANLKKNDQVVTSGGIHGTIVAVKDKTFGLRIDEGTKVVVDKNAIAYLKK
ncbi:MAG: preprotein translocase subunit YajC [Candidatus Omnitrophica bacterium]|nr:preprotein translocase subunit YajC [Candidatus Omnitrophota bacterium]MCF7893888.1 preprotein translocase subunit YajC [Candidatus Omnitrophota bacterium]